MNSFFQKIITIGAVLAISFAALAQPTWNRVDYTATMAFIGEVRINQYNAAFPRVVQEGDYIGAFVGNECRMIAKVVSYNSALYVSSVIHGGDVFLAANSGELLEFKLWNSTTNTAEPATIKGTLLSKPNDEILTYIIGKPNENAEVLSLEVANRSLQPAFSNAQKTYEIKFEAGAELPSLTDVSVILADKRAKYDVSLPTNFEDDNKLVVTVTAEDGTTKSVFTITCTQSACATPAPTVASNSVQFCVGDVATALTANGTNLKWYNFEMPLVGAPMPNTAVAHKTMYFVTQTTNCESAKTRVEIVVNALPTVSISANKTEVLTTETVSLTLVPAFGGTLSGSTGVVGLTFDPSKSALGAQTLTYSYIDANACANSDNITILVKNGVVAKPTINNPNITILVNEPAPVLEVEANGTITWYDKNKNKIGEGKNYPTNINTNNEGTYTYYVSNTVDGVESELVEITINVSNCSTPAPTVANANLKFCVGDVAPALSANGTNLKWFNGETPLAAAPTINTTVASTNTYFVTQTIGCESAKTRIDIVVNALPTVSIFASANEICTTEKMTVQLLPAGGNFSGPGTMLLTEFTPNPAAIGLQTMTYTYTNANNCSNTASTTVTIKNCPVEPITIAIVDKPILAINETHLMQATLTPDNAVAQVVWLVSNPAVASIDRNTGEITGLSSGLVKVTAQLANDKTVSDYITVRVVPQPVVTGVTVNSAGTEVNITFSEWIETPKNSVIFDILIYNGMQEYTIHKATATRNVLTLSLTKPIEDVNNVKIRYVGTSISSVLGALVPSFDQPIIATSIATVNNQLFMLYPTFTHDIVNIETSAEVDNIMIVNSQGQLIFAQRATAPLTQFSVAHLAQGNYSVVAFSKNQIVGTARFIRR
ncbi:MAG: Ig-like domain-containing protein [Bacteroidetes bacterium]|nr:Ig-like domain-containing protein [Bacteroidota bacterium]